jgi:hypothetical protein
MAKQPHQQEDTGASRTAMIAMVIGALLVAGLVVWALTRTVEAPTSAPAAANDQFPTTTVPITATTTAPTIAPAPPPSSPIASTTSPLVATPNTPPRPHIEGDKTAVHRIAAEDLREKFNANAVTIVDVRDQGSYERGHIPGAIHIQLSSVETNLDLLPKGKDIVTYCT